MQAQFTQKSHEICELPAIFLQGICQTQTINTHEITELRHFQTHFTQKPAGNVGGISRKSIEHYKTSADRMDSQGNPSN